MRDEATVDRIFAGDLDGLPNLSSRVFDHLHGDPVTSLILLVGHPE